MQCHASSFAQTESDWTFRDGDKSQISNISCTQQPQFPQHFILFYFIRLKSSMMAFDAYSKKNGGLLDISM